MSYINQDPDVVVPFKGRHVVATTRAAWMECLAAPPERSERTIIAADAACWCGSNPGTCNDCVDCDTTAIIAAQASGAKLHIGSGEDADLFR